MTTPQDSRVTVEMIEAGAAAYHRSDPTRIDCDERRDAMVEAIYLAMQAVSRPSVNATTNERLLDMVDGLYRKYGVELDAADVAIAQAARNAALAVNATDDQELVRILRDEARSMLDDTEADHPNRDVYERVAGQRNQMADRLSSLSNENGVLRRDAEFVWKWVERALFDKQLGMKNCLSTLAHYPGAPWNEGRWDVDHKPYAGEFYKEFPKARTTLDSTSHRGMDNG